MKTILYMGISINGYIAKADDNTDWTSKEDWDGFYKHSKVARNIILGKRTFDLAVSDGTFPFPDCLNVVMTHQKVDNKWGKRVVFTDKSPREILEMLQESGFKEVFVAGGGHINSSFMKDGLIDEIYVDVEPIVFGKGIQLFAPEDFEYKLKLLSVKNLNKNTVQLHYKRSLRARALKVLKEDKL
ncbi:dihydrofolate reductase [Candidatus Microgenomates bacterium]|nr:dihydrofolate reductase [Candidatus Microgenomates bacterium]